MKILLVTGETAKARVEEIARKYPGTEVFVASSGTASFASLEKVTGYLKGKDYDVVVFPGFIPGDLSYIEKETGTRAVKGPKDLADLPFVLERIGELELSPEIPACELLKDEFERRALEEIERTRDPAYVDEHITKPGTIRIGGLPVGPGFPMRVLAEIVDAETLPDETILERARYYRDSGADIIDIGISTRTPDRLEEVVGLLRDDIDLPLSVDTMEPENIERAVDCGADLILSFDRDLIPMFEGLKTPAVIIPRKNGVIPKKAEERISLLEESITMAKDSDFENIVADPVLDPAGFGLVESIIAYRRFKEANQIPILFGAGNVTELIDADSTGVNGLLCAIASECGADIVFSPEYSDKARGSISELATGVKMMFLARRRQSTPKDLGIDLLRLKDKRIRRDPLPDLGDLEEREARASTSHSMDRAGYFKIYVADKIYCLHFRNRRPDHLVTGTEAKAICDTLFNLGLFADYSHALYMGRELQRAEWALKNGTSYVQR